MRESILTLSPSNKTFFAKDVNKFYYADEMQFCNIEDRSAELNIGSSRTMKYLRQFSYVLSVW